MYAVYLTELIGYEETSERTNQPLPLDVLKVILRDILLVTTEFRAQQCAIKMQSIRMNVYKITSRGVVERAKIGTV